MGKKKISSLIVCLCFIYVLYQGCWIKEVVFFQNLPGTTIKNNVTFDELICEFEAQKKDNFAYIDSKQAIAYEIKEKQEYVEYVKIYVLRKIHGISFRKYTFVYHPMFILSLNESESYSYQNKKLTKFDNSLSLTGDVLAERSYKTGWNYKGIVIDTYTFYPVQNNSVTLQMSERMPYYFQIRIKGF